eukprot:1819333-Pleurochrysis_carterae.AAC.1
MDYACKWVHPVATLPVTNGTYTPHSQHDGNSANHSRTTCVPGRVGTTRVRASSSATSTAPRPGCASAQTARRSGNSCARERAQGLIKVTMLKKRTAAGWAQQEMRKDKLRRKPRKARCEGHRARTHRLRPAACRTLRRLEANGRRGPAGPAQEAQAPGQDWLRAWPAQPQA